MDYTLKIRVGEQTTGGTTIPMYETYLIQPNFHQTKLVTTDIDTYELTFFSSSKITWNLELNNGLLECDIYKGTEVKPFLYGYVTKYKTKIVGRTAPMQYRHTIVIVGAEYKLQRVVLPNKLITNYAFVDQGNHRSVYQALKRITDVYATWMIVDQRLETLLSMECPEMQFVKSTLYEVLCSLFSIGKLIPRFIENPNSQLSNRYNNLYCIDYGTKHTQITAFDDIDYERNIADYSDALDIDVENAIGFQNYQETEWIKATSEGNYLVTTDNFLWQLQNNIYGIKKVLIKGTMTLVHMDDQETSAFEIDISNRVVEESVYNSLKMSASMHGLDSTYKRGNLYYKQGDNKILGATFTEASFLGQDSFEALSTIVENYFHSLGQYTAYDIYVDDGNLRKVLMKVTYQSECDNTRVRVARSNVINPSNALISNQNDSYIDAYNYGKQQQEKLERLGCEMANGYLKCQNTAEIPSLMDFYVEDGKTYIATQINIQYKETCIDVMVNLSSNYSFVTGYGALKQQKRFTQIDRNRTIIRNDVIPYNITIGTTAGSKTNLTEYLAYYWGVQNHRNLHIVKTEFDPQQTTTTDSGYLLMNSVQTIIGNSIMCQIQFNDTANAGEQIDDTSNSAYFKKAVKYVDWAGEFTHINWYFGAGEYFRNTIAYNTIRLFPAMINLDGTMAINQHNLLTTRKLLNKDNGEIISLSMQFRFIEESGVTLYEEFYKNIPLIKYGTNTTFKIYESTTPYDTYTLSVHGNLLSGATIEKNDNQIIIANLSANTYKNLLIANGSDKIIMGLNDITSKITYNSDEGYYELKIYLKTN